MRFLAKSADLYHANKDGDSALTLAAAAGHDAIVQRLLVKGANVNHVRNTLDTALTFDTALTLAASAGHIDVVMILLAFGACIGHMNLKRETALSLAKANGHATVMDLLKVKGASDTLSPASLTLRRALDELEQRDNALPDLDVRCTRRPHRHPASASKGRRQGRSAQNRRHDRLDVGRK